MEDKLKELDDRIFKLEMELYRLKNERMCYMATTLAQLLKFEYATLTREMRYYGKFSHYVETKYSEGGSVRASRKCLVDLAKKAMLKITSGRTEKFEELSFEEKGKLRDAVRQELDELYSEAKRAGQWAEQ